MVDVVTLVCVGLTMALLYEYFRSRDRKPRAPGPRGYPLVGYGLQLTADKIHEQFFKFAQKYGHIFELQIFDTTTLVLNSADTINKAFCGEDNRHVFNDRPRIYFADEFYFGGASITFTTSPGKDHSDLRKLFTRGVHVYGDGVPKFEDVVKRELARVVDEIGECGDNGFEVTSTARRSVCNIMSMLLIGKEASSDDVHNFIEFVMGEDYFINPLTNMVLSNFPFLRYTPFYKHEIDKVVTSRRKILDKYFVDMKRSWKAGITRGLVDFYIADQVKDMADNKQPVMTDERIQGNVLGVIAAGKLLCNTYSAGTDFMLMQTGILTTSAAIPSTILCLLNNPGYQTKIQEELDRVVGQDREPAISDRHKCHFLEAVVMETLRYLPPVPMMLPHVCSTDTELEGYRIKAKTVVLANIWYIQHDETVWGDPWVFRPERFLDDNGKLLPPTHARMKSKLPFGIGRRRCPGDGLARNRIFLYLATFFQKWSFTPVPGKCGPCDPRVGEFDLDITFRPKPFYCIPKRRF